MAHTPRQGMFHFGLLVFVMLIIYQQRRLAELEVQRSSHRTPQQLTAGWRNHGNETDSISNVYVVFSTDCSDMQYASLAVLSAYVWKNHMNVIPIVFLHKGSHTGAARISEFLIDRIEAFGGQVHLVSPRQRDIVSTTLQIVRLVAYQQAIFQPTDIIITADADIWPLSPAFWQATLLQNLQQKLFIYNGPMYTSRRAVGSEDFVAISFLATSVQNWRRIYRAWCARNNLTANLPGSLHRTLWQTLDAGVKHLTPEKWWDNTTITKYGPQWSWDQIMAGLWLDASQQCPEHCIINDKVLRLDRSDWRWNEEQEQDDRLAIRMFTDAHLPFPLDNDDVYNKLERVWAALFDSTNIIRDVRKQISRVLEESKQYSSLE